MRHLMPMSVGIFFAACASMSGGEKKAAAEEAIKFVGITEEISNHPGFKNILATNITTREISATIEVTVENLRTGQVFVNKYTVFIPKGGKKFVVQYYFTAATAKSKCVSARYTN